MTMTTLMPIIMALLVTGIAVSIMLILYYGFIATDKKVDVTDQLQELIADEDEVYKEENIITKWNKYWQKVLGDSEISRYTDNGNDAGRDVAIFVVLALLLVSLATQNIIIGIFFPLACLYGFVMVIKSSGNKKSKAIDDQLSGLLFALKSNIQAGDTNERALMSVVDSMPSPLYEDLVIGRNILLANGTFQEALEEMRDSTSSKELKFLCACMIQAAISGANMTLQIDNIQRVLESRREVAAAIDKSVKAVSPALWLAGLIIPVMFVVSYFIDNAAKDFWFATFMGMAGFAGVVTLYIIGLVMTKSSVDKVRDI